jgi:precorrin-2/cobalt-factor-2 C20-methyltransferase
VSLSRTGPRLTGVGVGPGDPGLVTVRAVETLRSADTVFVPVSASGETGYAERVVLACAGDRAIERLRFTLGDDPPGAVPGAEPGAGPGAVPGAGPAAVTGAGPGGRDQATEEARQRDWDAAGTAVAAALAGGRHAAFATIGDPNLYSTFTYLADTVRALVPGLVIDTVPGITALQDLAARSGTVLAEGTQTLALLPFTAGAGRLAAALAEHDTVALYKGGRHLPEVRRVIADAGRLDEAVFGARLGLDGEIVGPLPEGAAPYLSTVLVRRPRGPRGGRL